MGSQSASTACARSWIANQNEWLLLALLGRMLRSVVGRVVQIVIACWMNGWPRGVKVLRVRWQDADGCEVLLQGRRAKGQNGPMVEAGKRHGCKARRQDKPVEGQFRVCLCVRCERLASSLFAAPPDRSSGKCILEDPFVGGTAMHR